MLYVGFRRSGAHASPPGPGGTDTPTADVTHRSERDPPPPAPTGALPSPSRAHASCAGPVAYIVVSITRAADAGRATERATHSTLTVSLRAELSAGGAARENVVGGAGGSGLS